MKRVYTNHSTTTPARRLDLRTCQYRGHEFNGVDRDRLGLDHNRQWFYCEHELRPLGPSGIVCPCRGCNATCVGYSPEREYEDGLTRCLITYDQHSLWPSLPGVRFNGSILADGDGYLIAFRDSWAGSEIWLGRLDANLRPVGIPDRLRLDHAEAPAGREDPRLFRFRGRVHLIYAGVVNEPWHTNQLIGVIEDRAVLFACGLSYPDRSLWEKNWAPFEYERSIYAIYRALPHRVLRLSSGPRISSWEVVDTLDGGSALSVWTGGPIRGGAPPVRVGNEYWHFFHDRVSGSGRTVYRVGLYTFHAGPPFTPLRLIKSPIIFAQTLMREPAVVFPCGAVRRGDDWLISMGVDDELIQIHSVSHALLCGRLEAI